MSARTRLLSGLLALLVVVAGAVLAWGLLQDDPPYAASAFDEEDGSYAVGYLPDDGAAPVEAAVAGAQRALGYDHRTLDEGLADATALMTDDFAVEFGDTFERVVRADALREKTVAIALVKGAGLVRQDGDRASVLVFVNQVLLSSTAVDAGQQVRNVAQSRVRVDVELVDGEWLVGAIEPL